MLPKGPLRSLILQTIIMFISLSLVFPVKQYPSQIPKAQVDILKSPVLSDQQSLTQRYLV